MPDHDHQDEVARASSTSARPRGPGSHGTAGETALRRATLDDLPACERIWRDGINDYLRRLNLAEVPEDNPGLRRLHAHALATDPERFWVATRSDGVERVVAFGSTVERGPVAYLSLLFVDPAEQARGLGKRLLREVLPLDARPVRATATDSAQPISNGLYASLGVVPRMPLFNLVGRPRAGWEPPSMPAGISITTLEPEDDAEVDAIDAEVLGFSHPEDHAFVRSEQPRAYAYRDGDRLAGYGYTSVVGRIGPIAARDSALLAPIVAHLLTAVPPRGASAIWIAGEAGPAVRLLLEAGLRFEDFPLLLGWTEPFADFARYTPISPGLL